MVEIVGVRFKTTGKIYYFSPEGKRYSVGEKVIVETTHGMELATISLANKNVAEDVIVGTLKSIVRRATPKDLKIDEENRIKEKDAFAICQKKIKEHNLEMNLVEVEYTFDRSKILFYFTADGRVDFRELVKSLAAIFHVRIELRQIGVRDETKMIGGMGICGRNVCCREFLDDFQPVSIKMAKDQNLSLNPLKISGICGRLMCCLKYEQESYEYLLKRFPKPDSIVQTPDGKGVVVDGNVLSGDLKVKLEKDDVGIFHNYRLEDVVVVKFSSHKHGKGGESKAEEENLKNLE